MPSILEYAETEFSLLAEKPFTDVDSLLLSQFSYMKQHEAFVRYGVKPALAQHKNRQLR